MPELFPEGYADHFVGETESRHIPNVGKARGDAIVFLSTCDSARRTKGMQQYSWTRCFSRLLDEMATR